MFSSPWARSTIAGVVLSQAALAAVVNITLTDQARMLTYGPSTVGVWNTSFSGSPWTQYDPGQFNIGYGTSWSSTSVQGATVSFTFSGVAVYVLGNQTEGSCTIDIDGDTRPSRLVLANGVLASAQVSSGYHDVTVSWGGQADLNLTGFILSVDLPGKAANIRTSEVMATSSNTTYNSVDFNFSKDDWAAVPEEAGSSNSSYPESETFQPYAEVTFNPPANASLMVIYGSTSPTDGPFALNLAPAAGVSASPNTSLTGPANQTYASNITDDTTKWASQNQVFAVRRLDTDVSSYTATVTSLAGRGLGFAFHSVEYYTLVRANSSSDSGGGTGSSASDSSSHSSTNVAAITAGVVVPVVVLLLLGILAFIYRRRLAVLFGSRKAGRKDNVDICSDDDLADGDVRPYSIPLEATNTLRPRQDGVDLLEEGTEQKAFLLGSTDTETSTYHTLNSTAESSGTNRRAPVPAPTDGSSGSAQTASTGVTASAGAALRLHNVTGAPGPDHAVRGAWAGAAEEDERAAGGSRSQERETKVSAGPAAARGGATRRPHPRRRPVHDTDAGRINDPGVELLPPTYNPEWGRPDELAEDAELEAEPRRTGGVRSDGHTM